MLQTIDLSAKHRACGKQISKRIRREGHIPGVFYTKGQSSINIQVEPLSLRPIVYTSHIKLINLNIEGQAQVCVLKDIKFHPVTDQILHFDLLGVQDSTPLTIEVPFEFIGQPVGVRKGGTFQQVFHKCRITCLPKDLVSSIQVDISGLDVGQSVHLRDIPLPGVSFGIPSDSLVCAVNIPRGKAGEALRESQK